MKSALFVGAASAALVAANPVDKNKRVMVTSWEVDYFTTTVTGDAPQAKPTEFWGEKQPFSLFNEQNVEWSTSTAWTQDVVMVTVTPPANTPAPTPVNEGPVIVTQTVQANAAPTVQDVAASPSPKTQQAQTASEPAADDMPSMAVYHHNLHRSNHSAPEMTWVDKWAGYASNTAASCNFAHDMSQGGGGYGQNIAMWGLSSGAQALGDAGAIKMATTDMWYNGEYFKYPGFGEEVTDMSDFEGWGHLSQLLWKDSTELGCAAQFCPKGTMFDDMDSWFMVCNYGPPGNVGGLYGKNVLKPLGQPVVT
ncbi:PR-1-like protein [Xylariomycetidae sp. FL0641]|nr:PR-1-like protein [Xylariomycetidae sp. FL0641]